MEFYGLLCKKFYLWLRVCLCVAARVCVRVSKWVEVSPLKFHFLRFEVLVAHCRTCQNKQLHMLTWNTCTQYK